MSSVIRVRAAIAVSDHTEWTMTFPDSPPLVRRAHPTRLSTVLALTLLSAACGGNAPADEALTADAQMAEAQSSVAPAIIDVSAGDFFFTLADTIAAGAVTLQLATAGEELHHLQLVRLAEGKTAEDLFREMQGDMPPAWAELVGGPNAPIPNATTSRVTLDLQPGTYVALCVIPSPDGVPHVAKGMSKTVVVTPAAGGAVLPTPTVKMSLVDYDFVMDTPLTAGSHVIEVSTATGQPHEVVIAKLAPGATAMQMVEWVAKMDGPPPGAPMGGTVGLGQGLTNYVHVDLEPGEYALLCFLPDAKDGKPHVQHGMMKQITVM
jgi:hypothetical protein